MLSHAVGARGGLILAALGNYTEVTDTLGHAASDELLRHRRAAARARAAACAAGPHGGRAVRGPAAGLSLAATERAARRLREAASTRARVAGLDLEVTLTIGVAAAPVHGTDAGTLMQRADVALLAASDSGGVASYHRSRPAEPAAPPARHRARAGDGRRADHRRLPADHRRADLRHRLRRDAGALGAPALRAIPPTTSSTWPSRSAGSARSPTTSSTWRSPAAALAGPGHRAVGRGEPLGALPDRARPRRPVRRALQRHGVPGELLTLELTEGSVVDDSVRDSTCWATCTRWACGCPWTTSARLLVAVPAAAAADRRGQDRQVLRARHVDQPGGVVHRPLDHRAGAQPGPARGRRGVEDELTRNLLAEMGCDKLQGFLVSRRCPTTGWRAGCWPAPACGPRAGRPPAAVRPHLTAPADRAPRAAPIGGSLRRLFEHAPLAQSAERLHGKEKVYGSIP